MASRQGNPAAAFQDTALHFERLGPLPLVNAFLERLDLEARLERFVPSAGRRVRMPFARSLLVLLRSLLIEREPIYRQAEVVGGFAPSVFGLTPAQVPHFSDDAVGHALDALFDADHEALVTDVVIAAADAFGVSLSELHSDSTSVSFTGQYPQQEGVSIRGKRPPFITFGFSKDHRPDLKQLLVILTTARDGDVPVQFRVVDGNTSDSRTHEETWRTLRAVTGGHDFLYVADSKLCGREAMAFIDQAGGRFVTIMPRSRLEDREFRTWIVDHQPDWQLVRDDVNPKDPAGPRDRWFVHRAKLPSSEGWPVTWVFSTLLKLTQAASRRERLARARQDLDELNAKLLGPRPRLRTKAEIWQRIEAITTTNRVKPYLELTLERTEIPQYKQTHRGRPGPNTTYKRVDKPKWRVQYHVDEDAIADAHASDGMYPLISNDRDLTPEAVLDTYKRRSGIEQRFHHSKGVLEIAPALLKNPGRIHALFIINFLALLVSALIERELRRAMRQHDIPDLPLYPEERTTRRPTAEQILKLFSTLQRAIITHHDQPIHTYQATLTPLQAHVLALLGVPHDRYTNP